MYRAFFRALRLALIHGLAILAFTAAAQEPTDAQLREEYSRWVALQGSHEYRARHILVQNQETAASVLGQLQAGVPFAKLAADHSLDTGTKNKGGELMGWVLPIHFTPRFRAAFNGTETGLHPKPIQTEFGWHVVEVLEARQANIPKFEEMRGPLAQAIQIRNTRAKTQSTQPAVQARSRPNSEWQALYLAALHTAGQNSYEYREAIASDYEKAQHISRFSTAYAQPNTFKARHLVDVPPHQRFALTGLYVEGDTTRPIERVLPDGTKQWSVLELVKKGKASEIKPGPEFERDTEKWIASGRLPDVSALSNPDEQAKAAYWQKFRPVDIDSIASHLSADVEYGNQSTPLLDAILGDQLELAKRLVQRGASVHRCGKWGCPIALAASLQSESRALVWVDWLLSQGAKVDQVDARESGRAPTALGEAISAGHPLVADKLMKSGANINGHPDASLSPAEAAALKLNKPLVEKLVALGASVLPRPSTRGVARRSIYDSVLQTGEKSELAWAEQLITKQASADPKFKLSVHVEQNGRVVAPSANGKLQLKAAPFKLVFAIPEASESVQIGASFDPAWVDEVKQVNPRNSLFRLMSGGALREADRSGSAYILVSGSCPAAANARDAEKGCDESYAIDLYTDPKTRNDFHEVRSGTPKRYVRAVEHFAGMASKTLGKPAEQDIPIGDMKGRTLYFVAGITINLGGPTGVRMVNPQYVELKLQ